jgi:hypothetical protein
VKRKGWEGFFGEEVEDGVERGLERFRGLGV